MKVIRIQASNVKKLQAFDITPKYHITKISGANGSGKTSALDTIEWALRGTDNVPSTPIRKGAERAEIAIDLGDIIVTRTFTAGGARTGALRVEEKGTKKRINSPQEMLNKLMGKISFDPLAFTRMPPKQQFEALRKLVKLSVDLDAVERERKVDYNRRKEIKREAQALSNRANAITIPAGLPKEKTNEAALLQQLAEAGQYNTNLDREARRRENITRDIQNALELVQRLQQQLIAAEADYNSLKVVPDTWAPLEEPRDAGKLQEQVEEARKINALIDRRAEATELTSQAEVLTSQIAKLTQQIRQRDQEKEEAIAAADFPIKGLAFAKADPEDEDAEYEVFYNGLPFNQASSAEQIRASVAIGMANHAELRVMRIEDGSLLDDDSMSMVAKMAEEHDYQVFMELVNTTGKVGVYLEDGEIAAINEDPQPEETPATTTKKTTAKKPAEKKPTSKKKEK